MASRAELVRERVQERPGTLPADFGEWDNGGPPAMLPAGFAGFDPAPVPQAKEIEAVVQVETDVPEVESEGTGQISCGTRVEEACVKQEAASAEIPLQAEAKMGEIVQPETEPVEVRENAPTLFASITSRRKWWWR